MEKFDVAIIGGGPAGYLAAQRADEGGKKVLLAEKNQLGGVCLNEGCIPTKTFLYSSKIYDYITVKSKSLGIDCKSASLNHEAVVARKNNVVKTLVKGILNNQKNVTKVYTEAVVKKDVQGFSIICGKEIYKADNVIVATGSQPIMPSIKGMEEMKDCVLTSKEILDITVIPKELVVVGGGVIGLEMAAYFNVAGSKVTVVEMLGSIGGAIDSDASLVLQKNLENAGVKFYLNSKVVNLSNNICTLENNIDIPYDKVLMSVGRKPCIRGLEEMGAYIKDGALVTDEKCATNIVGLYGAGDVNGKYMLAHVAYKEAEVAINNVLGIPDYMDYSAVPGVIYTQPEVAFAGITQNINRNVVVKKASINKSGRHMAECGVSEGFIKIVLDEKENIILGATLVSAYASEIIYPLTLMIQNKIPVKSIKKTIFPHPTVCEIIREVL